MMKNKSQRRSSGQRLTLLFFMVIFVFCVLAASVTCAAGLLYLLDRFGYMQPITDSRMTSMLAFLFMVSMFVSIIITIIAGKASLRPVNKFIDATKEIASGNFDVRFQSNGPAEFTRLVNSFNEMVEKLGSIETLHDDFVSNISHEFKTPVNSIKGFVKLLKRGNLTPAQQKEYLDIILAESERLSQLSSNMLLLSKLNSTDKLVDTSEFRLDEQLRRVILILDQQIDDKDLIVEVTLESCQIVSNQELLQQVWINLLNNAVKFTSAGGSISIKLHCRPDRATVVIADNGIGMAPDVAKHVFDKFYQGESSHTSEGNGLGLSLVKRIVDLCDGAIELSSEVGKGSIFTVTLPK